MSAAPERTENASEPIVVPASFPAAECVGARVASVRQENWHLLASLRSLREELAIVEAEAVLCGSKAMTMPEDLGDWSSSGPRIQGVVARILQTSAQSQELAKLLAADKVAGEFKKEQSPQRK